MYKGKNNKGNRYKSPVFSGKTSKGDSFSRSYGINMYGVKWDRASFVHNGTSKAGKPFTVVNSVFKTSKFINHNKGRKFRKVSYQKKLF